MANRPENVFALPNTQGAPASQQTAKPRSPSQPQPAPTPIPDLARLAEIWPPFKIDPSHRKVLEVAVRGLAHISRKIGAPAMHQAVEMAFRFDTERRKFARYDSRGLNAVQHGWTAAQEQHDQHRAVVSWQPWGWGWFELATRLTIWSYNGRSWTGTRVMWPGTRQVLAADYPEGMPLTEHFRQIGWSAAAVNPAAHDQFSPAPLSPASKILADYGVRAFVICRSAAIKRRLEGKETLFDKCIHRAFAISAMLVVLYETGGLFLGGH